MSKFNISISPWGISVIFGVLLLSSVIQSIFVYLSSKDRVSSVISEMTYIKDKTHVNRIMTEADRFLKVTTMYSEIIGRYGLKYHSKNTPNNQGFNKSQKAAVIKEVYQVSKLLDLPYFAIMVVGKMESSFGPKARTTNAKGAIVEAGWLQQRFEAVAQAKVYYDRLPNNYKKRLASTFNSMEDLYDPINATRIMGVLLWGYRRLYDNQWPWVFTTYHLGQERVYKYYAAGIVPTTNLVFNKGTLKEDVRDPFRYWHIFNAHNSQFERFDYRVYVEKSYIDKYMLLSSKLEWEFIQQWKWFQSMMKLGNKIKKDRIDFKETQRKDIAKWEKKLKKADKYFRRAKGILNHGKFKDIKDVWKIGEIAVRDFMKEIKDSKVAKMKKVILISSGVFIVIILCFSVFGLSMGVYLVFSKIRAKVKYKKVKEEKGNGIN